MADDFKWKESMFLMMRDNPSDEVNADYVAEIAEYIKDPVSPCNKTGALKLLRKFARKDFSLNTAIAYLEEYKRLPAPDYSKDDLYLFDQIIAFIESLPENISPSKLRRELKDSGIVKMTLEQLSAFIDMLGYLNILHTDESFGVTVSHTKERDMLQPASARNDFAHPVNLWNGKYGIDYGMIDSLFGDLY